VGNDSAGQGRRAADLRKERSHPAAQITGAIWYVKGKPDVLKNVIATVDTGAEEGRRDTGRGTR
jgi:hypothetical protein